jgi:acyl-ACP thioesterase
MFCYESKIRYSECDASRKLSPEALLNYLQDCSTFQSEQLGVGFDYLLPRNLAWVLASWQIVVHRYPNLGEEVVVGTLPYDFRGFLGSRNYLMKTKDGEILATANTLWTLLDFATMKPSIPTPEHLNKYPVEEKLDMEYAGRKIMVGDGGKQMEPVIVRKQHLDSNNHVNNGQYISIAGDYLPEGFDIYQIRAEYKKQAHLGDVFQPYVVTEPEKIVVSLRDENGSVYMNAEFTARKV